MEGSSDTVLFFIVAMLKWSKYTGDEIIYNALDVNNKIGGESMLEDAVKQGILISSGGECQLLKFHYTDGFGWYFQDQKITFILHECKVGIAGKTIRGYKACLRKSFLQIIGYYYKIKTRQFNKFSKKLVGIAQDFGYEDVTKFVMDHFGMFLITTPKFVSQITVSDFQEVINGLENLILEAENKGYTPSTYWKYDPLREAMEQIDLEDVQFEMMPDNVDLANTGEILNKILTWS